MYRKSSCKNKIQRALSVGKESVDHFLTKCFKGKRRVCEGIRGHGMNLVTILKQV